MVRYLHSADHIPRRIRKVDFKDITYPEKKRIFTKVKKKSCIGISLFGYDNKQKYPVYVLRKALERLMDLLLIREGKKALYPYPRF